MAKLSKEVEDFFEKHWKMYPRKMGKGSISDKKKTELHKLGGQFTRCIERYLREIQRLGTKEKYIKHGSTFFNSGYVDFLDENYNEPQFVTSTSLTQNKRTGHQNFSQTTYQNMTKSDLDQILERKKKQRKKNTSHP